MREPRDGRDVVMQLKAKNDTEKRLLDYLEANASDALKEKIAALPEHGYNLDAAYRHIRDEARKKLNSGGGFIADEVVFGWLVHYYEDVAPAEAARAAKAREEAAKKKVSGAPGKSPEKRTRKQKPADKAGVGQNRQPVDGVGSSKSVTKARGVLDPGENAGPLGTRTTLQDGAVAPSSVASSTPPPGGSQEQRRTDGGGGSSAPESDAPPTPASLPVSGASDSGFAFILFDADEKKGGEA